MTSQISTFIRPAFSAIIEMTVIQFFFLKTVKEFVGDTLKALEIVRTTFKRMSHFFIGDNLITTLRTVHIQRH